MEPKPNAKDIALVDDEDIPKSLAALKKQVATLSNQFAAFQSDVKTEMAELKFELMNLIEKKFAELIQEGMINTPSKSLLDFDETDALKNSRIVTGDEDLLLIKDLLHNFKENYQLLLLFRATEHGFSAYRFHYYCDLKGPTLILAQTNIGIVGGLTSISWDSHSSSRIGGKENIIFFMKDKRVYKLSEQGQAIVCNGENGPIFGTGADLYFSSDLRQGFSAPGNYILEGSKVSFIVSELEVYQITSHNVSDIDLNIKKNLKIKIDSLIIQPNAEGAYVIELIQKFSGKTKPKKLFSASLQGYSANAFHRYCSNVAPTIVVAKTSIGILGGVNTLTWEPTGEKYGGKNFIFFAKNQKMYHHDGTGLSIVCKTDSGPVFGIGADLYFSDDLRKGFSASGNYKQNEAKVTFNVLEFEVFAL